MSALSVFSFRSFNILNLYKLIFQTSYTFPTVNPSMEKTTLEEVRALFKRLKEAKKQAEALQVEIRQIQSSIYVLSESEIFKNHLLDSSDFTDGPESLNSNEPPKKKNKYDFHREDDYVIVYTDGACENNGRANAKAGIGVWFGDNHPLNISKPVNGKATNNVAEIQACIEALKAAKENGINSIKILTDSQFTINCMTNWIKKWKKNNWKLSGGGDVKNKEELVELDRMCSLLNVKWQHVDGHKGIKGNEEADRLARQGAVKYGK